MAQKNRLSCRVNRILLDWVRWYAAQRGTTVTQIVIEHFTNLRKNYENRGKDEVDQL
ncbi:MAG: hypothetical protein ACXAEU_23820 [Candidatus Hodarchaeales archaeon]